MKERKIINGVTTPSDAPLTRNELTWVEYLRIISADSDPAFGLDAALMLRLLLRQRSGNDPAMRDKGE